MQVVAQNSCFSQIADTWIFFYFTKKSFNLHADAPDGLEVLPAQNILQEQELLGSQVTQWESFMLGLPSFVLKLGKTVVMSSAKDFPLNNTRKKLKFLHNPQSFKACLHQVNEV